MRVKRTIKAFNMVEIVSALILVAFGVVAVMAILQPSVRASRDSVGDNYCADVSNQFMSFIEAKARKSWTTVVASSASALTSAPPKAPPVIADTNIDTPESWGGQLTGTNIYTTGGMLDSLNSSGTITDGITKNGIYGIKIDQDFAAHVRVWKRQVDDFAYGTYTTALPMDKAIRFCIEISYPASKPYSVREKRFYSLEVFNQ